MEPTRESYLEQSEECRRNAEAFPDMRDFWNRQALHWERMAEGIEDRVEMIRQSARARSILGA